MKLKNQVAVVTGAGRNIGEEIAKLFAAEGAKVAGVDIDRPRGARVVAGIRAGGGGAELFPPAVSNGGRAPPLVARVVARCVAATALLHMALRPGAQKHI